jgi:hypothetical protein
MPCWPGPSTYDPLTRYLAALTVDEATLTFGEIERLVGAALPASARQSSYWTRAALPWGPQHRPWTRAGWRVVRAHLETGRPAVTFARGRSASRT